MGRRKLYETDAEKHKAFRERKKEEISSLKSAVIDFTPSADCRIAVSSVPVYQSNNQKDWYLVSAWQPVTMRWIKFAPDAIVK